MAPVKVLSSAWRALAGLYRLPGQESAPPALELGLPVQPVHDLSRQAEVARQTSFEIELPQVVGAAATDRTTFTLQALRLQASFLAAVRSLGLTTPDVDVWLLSIDATSPDPSDLGVCLAGFIGAGDSWIGDPEHQYLLYAATAEISSVPIVVGGDQHLCWTDGIGGAHDPRAFSALRLPLLYPPALGAGLSLVAASAGGAGFILNWKFRFLITPLLVRPVGVA